MPKISEQRTAPKLATLTLAEVKDLTCSSKDVLQEIRPELCRDEAPLQCETSQNGNSNPTSLTVLAKSLRPSWGRGDIFFRVAPTDKVPKLLFLATPLMAAIGSR